MLNSMCPFSWAALRALSLYCTEIALPADNLARHPAGPNWLTQTDNNESARCQALLAQLRLQTDDQVLAIGLGQGETLGGLLAATPQGSVTGVASSLELVTQAARRYQFSIKGGRLELEQAEPHALPFEYGRFSKVLVAHDYANWENPEYCLNEMHRVLRKDGKLVIGLRLKSTYRWLQRGTGCTQEETQEIAGLVRWVGFADVKLESQANDWACVTARR